MKVLTSEGYHCPFIGFIKEGECHVLRKVDVPHINKKTGIKELLERIHLLAEVAELKANPDRPGNGTVIESRLEKGRGNVATLLVQDGTVKIGQHIVAGLVVGRVKSLTNDRGEKVQEALPGMPVEVLGLDGTPLAGDKFDVVRDEKIAEEA